MERTAVAVRVTEAIPAAVRMVGWLLILGPAFVFIVDGPGPGGQLRSLVDQGFAVLGLGAGIAPLEFLAFAWVAVAMIFWAQAHIRGGGLGRKSSLVFVVALGTQVTLFLLSNSA
jgi:hypothetical protein